MFPTGLDYSPTSMAFSYPTESIFGICTYIQLISKVNVGKLASHMKHLDKGPQFFSELHLSTWRYRGEVDEIMETEGCGIFFGYFRKLVNLT